MFKKLIGCSLSVLVLGCSGGAGLADPNYPGKPLAVARGRLLAGSTEPSTSKLGIAIFWQPPDAIAALGGALLNGGSHALPDAGPVRYPEWTSTCQLPPSETSQDIPLPTSMSQSVAYQAIFPVDFAVPIVTLPPAGFRLELGPYSGEGRISIGVVVAYEDRDEDGQFDFGSPEQSGERILAASLRQDGITYLVFLDGRLPPSRDSGAVPLDVRPGFSWVTIRGSEGAVSPLTDSLRLEANGPANDVGMAPLLGCSSGRFRFSSGGVEPATSGRLCSETNRSYRWTSGRAEACVLELRQGARCLAVGDSVPADWPCR